MALHSLFIAFLMFNLSLYLSHGDISDTILSQPGGLVRGFDEVQGARSAKKRETETDKANVDVPRFLLDLYRKRTYLPRRRLNERESEIVRVFLREPAGKDQHEGSFRHLLFFNLSTISVQENIKKAELRIYKKKPPLEHSTGADGDLKIRLFRLKTAQNKSFHLRNNKFLVASHLVSLRENIGRWITFDVTSAVKFWKNNPEDNFGIRLTVQGMKAFPAEFRIGSRGKRAPFLVTYTDNPQLKQVKSSQTFQNCTNAQAGEEGDDIFLKNTSTTQRSRAKRSAGLRTCRRRWVYVHFKKLKWNWIIAPSGYSANYCEGACSRVLHMHLEPTNHAILQNILHRMDSRIPSPSCAPTKLHGISVLYKTSDRSIALTEYGGMVVSTCGCH